MKPSIFFCSVLVIGLLVLGCQDNSVKVQNRIALQQNIEELDSIHNMLNALEKPLPPDSFFTVYSRISVLYELIPDTSFYKINSYFKVCDELNRNGGYHEAIRQGLHGISISEHPRMQNNGENNRQLLYGLMAGCYIRMGHKDSALIIYRKAVERSHLIGDTIAHASALNNLGVFFYRENQIDSARRCFLMSDSLMRMHDLRELWMRNFHGSVKTNLATLSEMAGDYETTLQIYRENYKLYIQKKNPTHFISTGISLANAMLETGSEGEAKILLDELNNMLDTIWIENKLKHLIRLNSVYHKYHERLGNFDQALSFADKEIQLSDSLRKLDDNKMSKAMASLADINSAQFSLKIALEKQAGDAMQRANRLRFWVIFAVMFSGLGALSTMFVVYRQRSLLLKKNAIILEDKRLLAERKLKEEAQEKRLAELELENKQKDLVQMAMHLTQKQEWARYLNSLFERIENSKGYQRQKELANLKSEIRNQLFVDNEIELLQQNIATLSASFYNKLIEQFPDLTKTEIRMCSYIRMDLATDQIAQLQNIDPASIKVRRFRLKKKLRLSQDDNLDAFLRSL